MGLRLPSQLKSIWKKDRPESLMPLRLLTWAGGNHSTPGLAPGRVILPPHMLGLGEGNQRVTDDDSVRGGWFNERTREENPGKDQTCVAT